MFCQRCNSLRYKQGLDDPAVSELIIVRGISNKDAEGMISDLVKWSCFVCEGEGENGNFIFTYWISLHSKKLRSACVSMEAHASL